MSRPNQPSIKIICVGLGRTGTLSMSSALEILGFGPSYHIVTRGNKGPGDLDIWNRVGNDSEDGSVSELLDDMFQGYQSILDYPAAVCAKALYTAYPNAKYILTIRDPAKWEESIKEAVLNNYEIVKTKYPEEMTRPYIRWFEESLSKYHQGRLLSHPQEQMLKHNERIKKLIPAQQLLVYEIGEGWERLAKFLEVPVPKESFPHLNNAKEMTQLVSERLADLWKI